METGCGIPCFRDLPCLVKLLDQDCPVEIVRGQFTVHISDQPESISLVNLDIVDLDLFLAMGRFPLGELAVPAGDDRGSNTVSGWRGMLGESTNTEYARMG